MKILTKVFNIIVELEYIPSNFRRGTQIPLYKGKNTCPLDVNNYRGITLLTCMNKMVEILIWERVKVWWSDQGVISPLQGACHKGSSCLHSDPLLREIESSGYVCRISNVPASPVSYADDLSVCSFSKYNLDKVLRIVYNYSCEWRFYYNASKSAVMVYGDW